MKHVSPTIAQRGKLAHLMAAVQHEKPQHGERAGTMRCSCGATLHYVIQAGGISRGHCAAACGVRWCR